MGQGARRRPQSYRFGGCTSCGGTTLIPENGDVSPNRRKFRQAGTWSPPGEVFRIQVKYGKIERRHRHPGGFQTTGSRPANHRKPESSRSRAARRSRIRPAALIRATASPFSYAGRGRAASTPAFGAAPRRGFDMQPAIKPGRNGRRPQAVRARRNPVLRACMPRRLTRPEGRRSPVKSVLVWQKRRSGR